MPQKKMQSFVNLMALIEVVMVIPETFKILHVS